MKKPWLGALIAVVVVAVLWALVGLPVVRKKAASANSLRLGAAASLEPALVPTGEAPEGFVTFHVTPAFASSGRIAAQLRAGAPFDVVILASSDLADDLHDDGLIGEPVDVAGNRLVLAVTDRLASDLRAVSPRLATESVGEVKAFAATDDAALDSDVPATPDHPTTQPADATPAANVAETSDDAPREPRPYRSQASEADETSEAPTPTSRPATIVFDATDVRLLLGQAERVAIGEPSTVPVGTYARQALVAAEEWDPLEGRLVYGASARQIADYLQRGEVDAAVLYESDAAGLTGVQIVHVFPPNSHDPIRYPAAVVKGSQHPEAAAAVVVWLASEEGRAMFDAHGFKRAEP